MIENKLGIQPELKKVFERATITPEGGIAVRFINTTGAPSIKGTVVTPSDTVNHGIRGIVIDVPDPVGVVYEDDVPENALVWVVVAGIADVSYVGSTTRGHLSRGFIGGEANYEPGKALSEAFPTSPFASDKHFYEIGHVMESRTGAGLAKTLIHFN